MGKSLKAVFSPQKFVPSLIDRYGDFESLWETNRKWVLSNMAHIAYFGEKQIKEFAQVLGANETHYYDMDGAQAFLATWDSKAILTFRGSQPAEDESADREKTPFLERFRNSTLHKLNVDPQALRFLSNDVQADLEFKKVPFDETGKVRVHSGFLKEIDKLWGSISSDLERHAGNIPIWVTGHSLGAAMATLAGMKHPFEEVITFGEPRVGVNVGQAFQAKNHTRYVNGDDPVTRVPPEAIFGYDHHGNAEKISDSNGNTDFKFDHSIVYYSENLA